MWHLESWSSALCWSPCWVWCSVSVVTAELHKQKDSKKGSLSLTPWESCLLCSLEVDCVDNNKKKKNPSHGSSKAKWGKGRWHLELQTFPQLLSLCFWSQAAVQTLWWFVIKPKAWRFCGVLIAYQVKVNLVSIMEYFSSVTPWGSLGTDRPFILNRWPRLKKTLFVC